MSKGKLVGSLSAIALALAAVVAQPAGAQQYYGGMMGPGMGQGMMMPGMMGGMMGSGMMMGPGMMGGMMGPSYTCPWCGPGMMGWGYGVPQASLNLSVNDVKSYLDRWIAISGNPHVKAGAVTEKDSSTITADIVTTDKEALVQRFNIDRRTGVWQPA